MPERDQLRVAVVGYYGHLNAGDDLLQAALSYALSDHLLLFSSWYSLELLNDADLVIVGGGSQWPGSAFFRSGGWIARRLRAPLMVVGISATRADDEVRAQTESLIDRAVFFHVRDEETRALLGDHPDVVTGTDLFWWMPWDEPPTSAPAAPATAALALRDWGIAPWDPAAVVAAVRESLTVVPYPFHYGSMLGNPKSKLDDRAFLRQLGLDDVPSVWSAEPARSDVTVAMRYHAIQVATRFGRPVIGLDVDPKIRRFFEEHGVAELCVEPGAIDDLRTALERLRGDYPSYCRTFAAIRDRMSARGRSDLAAFEAALAEVRPRSRADTGRVRAALGALLRWARN